LWGCYVTLQQETLIVKQGRNDSWAGAAAAAGDTGIWQVANHDSGDSGLAYGRYSHCLSFTHGLLLRRILPIERGYRQLSRYQQQLSEVERLLIARQIVQAKLKIVGLSCSGSNDVSLPISALASEFGYLVQAAAQADTIERLMGFEVPVRLSIFLPLVSA